MPAEAELVLDARAALGEGAIWHAAKRRLYWVDIDGGIVHEFDPAAGRDRDDAPESGPGNQAVQPRVGCEAARVAKPTGVGSGATRGA